MPDKYHGFSSVIAQAIADARAEGLDHVDQNGRAVQKILDIDPDKGAVGALNIVRLWRAEYGR